MGKMTFMGAGSAVFARNVMGDMMLCESLRDFELALYDIDAERLEESYIMIDALNKNINEGRAKITKHLGIPNRKEALRGANFVVDAIQVGGYEPCTVTDFEIPKKYGLRQTIADTLGIGGIFRALRTIPVLEGFAEDMDAVCPNAWFLNYTNPMAMLAGYMQRYTPIKTVGLCHSVQVCARGLLNTLGIEYKEPIRERIAGINHMGWLLEIEDADGNDLYPEIRRRAIAKLEEELAKGNSTFGDLTRYEYIRRFGYYCTESSEHNSEYNAWFRKRQELIDTYVPDSYAASVKIITDRTAKRDAEMEKILAQDSISLARGAEYASGILNAIIGDGTIFEFHGNVPNTGLIPNLPEDAIVEVTVYATRHGMRPAHVGNLPRHLAALNTVNAQCETLAVDGLMACDREMIFHAILNDPLTAAVCSLAEIRAMTEEMFEANREDLPMFH